MSKSPYKPQDIIDISEKVMDLMRLGLPCGQACIKVGVNKTVFLTWLNKDDALRNRYAEAADRMMDFWADEVLTVSDEKNLYVDQNGVKRTDGAAVQQQRLRVDSRKWLLSKLKPQRYGERIVQEHVGADGGPISFNSMSVKNLSDEELETFKTLAQKAQAK